MENEPTDLEQDASYVLARIMHQAVDHGIIDTYIWDEHQPIGGPYTAHIVMPHDTEYDISIARVTDG